MIKYKLTTQDNKTRVRYENETLWGENVTHKTSGKGDLCGEGWLHYYHSPELASFLNPIHASIDSPKLWKCEASGEHRDDSGLKGGCTELTTIEEIPLMKPTNEQRVAFSILCSKKVYIDKDWNAWADKWLSGDDRSDAAAAAYYSAAYSAAAAAAAYSAAAAAYSAAYSAATVAYYSAAAAAFSAEAAANANIDFSLQEIAEYCINNF